MVTSRTGLGPFILLMVYCLAAGSGLYFAYTGSDAYKIGQALQAGDAIVGGDRGQSADVPHLEDAARHYYAALAIDPNQRWAWQQLKSIHWRFQERDVTYPRPMALEEAALGARADKPDDSGLFGQLPVTPENRYPDALDAIHTAITYTVVGFVVLFLWALWSFMGHRRELARVRRAMAERQADTSALY